MKAEHINPFLTASQKIIKTVLNLDLKMGELSLKEEHFMDDIMSIMIWVKGDFHGRVMFCIKNGIACDIASIMMRQPVEQMDEMAKSAVGELANMILGRAGIIFANRGINVIINPPIIIEGKKLAITPISDKKILNIPLLMSNNEMIDMNVEIRFYK